MRGLSLPLAEKLDRQDKEGKEEAKEVATILQESPEPADDHPDHADIEVSMAVPLHLASSLPPSITHSLPPSLPPSLTPLSLSSSHPLPLPQFQIDVIGAYQLKEWHNQPLRHLNIAAIFTVFFSLLAFILALMCCMSNPISVVLVNHN